MQGGGHYPRRHRDPAELAPTPVELTEEEIEEAQRLLDSMALDDLEGPEFVDHYTDAVAEVIKAKREGHAPPTMPAQEPAGEVVDLMSALQESVRKAQAARGESDETEEAAVHEVPKKASADKTVKKALTKKTAAQKATTKKKPKRSA
ncbi:hypothetical protein ACFPH6_47245 [Streptomyces xiangluensis]|uniref:DNA end-binding protein Ku n=1 Tax=Streptomyces xiangluensis TaxID=2665720 RepID=A0ABV8Z3M7_9ACTN